MFHKVNNLFKICLMEAMFHLKQVTKDNIMDKHLTELIKAI
jgi:hypothetical protein